MVIYTILMFFSLDAALDLELEITRKYSGTYFFEEAKGLSEGSGADLQVFLLVDFT